MSKPKDTVRNLDFSQLTYDEWLKFFFDKPIEEDVFWKESERYDAFIIAEPAKVVGYFGTTECETSRYLWEIFGRSG
jgi:hypothetical protein